MQGRNTNGQASNSLTRRGRGVVAKGLFAASVVALSGAFSALGAGCLSRPVVNQEPTLKTNFTAVVKQQGIDKVDILFMIDNSASMGDKQALLGKAVPDLVDRLVNPFCTSEDDANVVVGQSKDGACATGKIEFPPVHDMHLGIVSSALGGKGSDACPSGAKNPVNTNLDTHNDDQAHLLNRGGADEHAVASAGSSNFLGWFPDDDKNKGKTPPEVPIKSAADLQTQFQDLVAGVKEFGCGFEAQLESWYRFLIQPDPYQAVNNVPRGRATLTGIDNTILKQRKDFLRPDSLVAVIMVTDETENMVDPLSVNGQGWAFMDNQFPGNPNRTGTAARGTSACDTNPGDANCTSCGFKGLDIVKSDPNCTDANSGYYAPEDDALNVRPINPKKRFGVNPFFPLSRYTNGLTSFFVPNRNGEHPPVKDSAGNTVPSGNYVGDNNCTNPLYAAVLPEEAAGDAAIDDSLCKLTRGPRQPENVFFAIIGGVPWQLLTKDPTQQDVSKVQLLDKLREEDWVRIVGKDPVNFDYTGIDQHMVESITPRTPDLLNSLGAVNAIGGGAVGLPDITAADNADPVHGREWDTKKTDLQYACTFPLPAPGARDCNDPAFKPACDCTNGKTPSLCDRTTPTTQLRGKAYPGSSHLIVARSLGDQAIVSSICPIKVNLDPANPTDPLFGYRPAVKSIVDRLRNALSSQCLPFALTPSPENATQAAAGSGVVPCLILEALPLETNQAVCDTKPGRKQPDADILKKFRDKQRAEAGDAAGASDLSKTVVCQINQVVVKPGETCVNEGAGKDATGWCYVVNKANGPAVAGQCPQAIVFSSSKIPEGNVSLQCINASEAAATADGGKK